MGPAHAPKSDQKWGRPATSQARCYSPSRNRLPGGQAQFTVLFKPTASRTLADYSFTRSRIVLNLLNNVVSEVETVTPAGQGRRLGQEPSSGAGQGHGPCQRPA